MKAITRYSFLFFIAMILVSSCQKIEADAVQSRPVVEGYLEAGHPISVKVTSEALFSEADTSRAIDGLNLQLTVDGQTYPLTYDNYGVYRENSLLVESGRSYAVQFNYKDKVINSSATIPGQPVNFQESDSILVIHRFNSSTGKGFPLLPSPIVLRWENTDLSYYLVVVKNIETNPERINLGVSEPVIIFRTNPIQTNTYPVRARLFQYYGRHRIILYKINAEYAALYQDNGSSSLNIKTPFTNVINGLGIFTGINSDTVMLRIKKN